MKRFSQTEILITVAGCLAGIIIAVIEGRRAPVEESLRYRMDGIHDRLAIIEQKYMAYPPARELLERWAQLDTMQADLARQLHEVEEIAASFDSAAKGKDA